MTKSLAAALLISTATFAHAQNVVATGAEPDQPAPRHADGRIGLLLGGADVGDAQGFSAGASLGVGYRIGDVSVRGLLDYYKVGDGQDAEMPRHGRAARVGGAVRYSLASTERDADMDIDFWGELGAGWEHV